jgi:hypothetical protein
VTDEQPNTEKTGDTEAHARHFHEPAEDAGDTEAHGRHFHEPAEDAEDVEAHGRGHAPAEDADA